MANILLAEDDTSMRHFLTAALERAGHSVTPCDDGLTAMGALQAADRPFDLLLADIVMPGMDGIELSQRAGRIFPHLKTMFITGFAAMALGERGAGEEKKVISKPFHLSQLIGQIDEILHA